MDIRPEILDELLASTDDPEEIFGTDGLLASLTARLVERVTEAELDHHLHAEHAAGRKNTRNGKTKRRLLSARGPLDVSMPSPPAGGEATGRPPSSPSSPRSTSGGCPTSTSGRATARPCCCSIRAASRPATSKAT